MNATIEVAAAQARFQHAGHAIGLSDLAPEKRPRLALFEIPETTVLDVVSADGISALGFPDTYPVGVTYKQTQPLAILVHSDGIAGVACLSNAEAHDRDKPLGEELALFDDVGEMPAIISSQAFEEWFPGEA